MTDTEGQDFDEVAADLAMGAKESYESNRKDQHDLLDAVAEEDSAPLLETKCEIYGHVIPVSGRLTGEFVERIEALDAEAKRRASGEGDQSGVSDIIRELAEILDDLIDDPELTANGIYGLYLDEGPRAVRTIVEEVLESLKREEERVQGDADGFRSEPDGT